MINTELYETSHGSLSPEISKHVEKLNVYFKKKMENVVGVTLMPNFCVDNDMTNWMHSTFPDLKSFSIYRGLLVELRANYKLSAGDIQFIYPQLCKQRGIIEIPKNFCIDTLIARIKDIVEMKLTDVKGKLNDKNTLQLSPLYNNISLYKTSNTDNEWGISEEKILLGYDLSCDKFLINYWKYQIADNDQKISDFYNSLVTTKIEGSNVKTLVNEHCKGIIEYITDIPENELNFVTDMTTNWVFRNDHEYFVFNHCVNLLSLQKQKIVMGTSMLAGLKVYKNLVNNNHKYKYAYPYDTGFTNKFHSWDLMNDTQKERLGNSTFFWNRQAIPFNTYLMAKVNSCNSNSYRVIESELQVIPVGFYKVFFSRLSSHNVYMYLDAKDVIKLQPGNKYTMINFPLHSSNVVTKLLVDNYDKFKQYDIINSKYYDENINMLCLPRQIASLVLSFE